MLKSYFFSKKILSWIIITISTFQLCSCGYFLYPERRGQKTTAYLDWPIVGLDAIGLIFFIIPGVIAFAVDFTSGTIYLPNGRKYSQLEDLQNAKEIKLDKMNLTQEKIADAVKKETGVALSFNDPRLIRY